MHVGRRRARDEDAGEVEQQRRVLVGAGVEALQRDQEIAAAKIRIADQVEGRIGRDETVVLAVGARADGRAQARMMRSMLAIGNGLAGRGGAAAVRMGRRQPVEQLGERGADREPSPAMASIARRNDRRAERRKTRRIAQRRQAGARQQRPQRRIGDARSCRISADARRRRPRRAAADRTGRRCWGRLWMRSVRGRLGRARARVPGGGMAPRSGLLAYRQALNSKRLGSLHQCCGFAAGFHGAKRVGSGPCGEPLPS